jgi:hypothetical protein
MTTKTKTAAQPVVVIKHLPIRAGASKGSTTLVCRRPLRDLVAGK